MNLPAVVFLTLVSSCLILDKYAFGEFGFSQPLIAGTIIGALCGDMRQGILIGSVFQLIFLGGLPIGRDIPPDGPGGSLIATGIYFLLRSDYPPAEALTTAVLLGLVASLVGGALEITVRRQNEKLYHLFVRQENRFTVVHLAGLATAFIRGLLLFFPFFGVAALFRPAGLPSVRPELILIIAQSAGLANVLYLFVKKKTYVYALIGGLCGLALFVL